MNFKQAIDALVDNDFKENPEIYFNLGNVYMKKEDFI